MDPHILRIVSRGKTPATGRLEHLPKLWLHAPVRFELACAAPEDTAAALAATPTYSISIHSLDASRQPVDDPLLWYDEVASQTANDGKSKGPHAIFDLSAADIANITAAGEYWLAFHAYPGGERIVRAAGYLTFADDGFPTDPPTPTPPGTVYLTQAAGDSRYVRDPGTVVDNRLVRWDGVSGNTVQSSLVTVGDDGSISTPGTFTANRVKVKTGTYEGDVTSSLLTNDRAHALPNADGTLALTTNVNGAPDRMELRVKCDEAGGVTLGQAVYIYGANGGNKLIRKAIASGEATSSKTIGLVSQALAHNAFGYVVTEGHVDVSLAKGSAVEGDPVWLSPATAGGVVFGVAAKPSAPNHMVFMGYITRITGANVTEIFVRVQNGFELEELHNVAISTPSTGHVLTWNGTLWVNSAPSGGGSVTVTGQDGIGVAGSPGTSITLSLGNITPDALDVTGTTVLRGAFTMIHAGDLDIAISAANLTEGGATVYWPGAGGNLATVAGTNGAILASDVTDGTTVGRNIFKLANPGAVTFLRMNADNTVTALSDSSMRSALGLGTLATQSGTFSGTSSGTNTGDQTITLTGDVTGSGTGSFAATIAANAVTAGKIASNAVTTSKLDAEAVTYAKIQPLAAASTLLGRGTAGGTTVREISIGAGLAMSGDTLSASGTGNVVGPASSTANAVARFNLTTGKLIQESAIVIDDIDATTQQNVAIRNVDPAANSAIVITPKGTGAFIVGPKPDGLPAAGNARGANAVDFQRSRTAAAYVASGFRSVILNGGGNTASGYSATVLNGDSNQASNFYASVLSGQSNVASGNASAVTGTSNTASGADSAAIGGTLNTASGGQALCLGGNNNTANATRGLARGQNAVANRIGMQALANGQIVTTGDAQRGTVVMRRQTTDATPIPLSIDGAAPTGASITTSTHFLLLNNQTCSIGIRIIARSSAGADHARFLREIVISRDANSASTVIENEETIGTDFKTAGASGWGIAITADTTNGGLLITVTGAASTTINWVAFLEFVETIRA